MDFRPWAITLPREYPGIRTRELLPRPELVGKVEAVNGSMLALADAKDDMQSVAANEVWLEKRAFPDYLAHRFQGR